MTHTTYKTYHIRLIGLISLIAVFALGAKTAQASALAKIPNNLGLSIYWSMADGTGGQATDFSGKGNTGTVNSAGWTTGRIGTGLNFNNTLESVTLPTNSTVAPSNAFTLGFWIKVTDANGGSELFDKVNGVNQKTFRTTLNSDNTINFGVYNASDTLIFRASSAALVTSTWTYVTGVYDGTGPSLHIYMNGSLSDGSLSGTVPSSLVASNAGITLGYTACATYTNNVCTDSGNSWIGALDEARMYTRALSATDVSTLYGQIRAVRLNGGMHTGLAGYWPFQEGSGTVTADLSGNNNTGTVNTATWTIGKVGTALNFNNTLESVDVGNGSSLVATTGLTVGLWVNVTNANGGNELFTKANGPAQKTFRMTLNTDNTINFGVYNTSASGTLVFRVSSSALATSTWTYVTGVYDGSATTLHIYFNGALADGTLTGSVPSSLVNSNADVKIGFAGCAAFLSSGTCNDTGNSWIGLLDEARMYTRALSASEVKRLSVPARINSSRNNSITNGLILLNSFDGADLTTTTSTDRSGQGNDGILSGASGSQNKPQPSIGKIGQALKFDGTDDKVLSKSNTGLSGNTAASISIWIKPSDLTNLQCLASFGNPSTVGGSMGIFINENGGGSVSADFSAASALTASGVLAATGQWYHVVITKSPGAINTTVAIYVNGAAIAISSAPSTTPNITNQTFTISDWNATPSTHYYFNGVVDDVRLYNRALSAAEVLQLYTLGK